MFDMKHIQKLPALGESAGEGTFEAFRAFDERALADGANPQEIQGAHGRRRGAHHAVPLLHRTAQGRPP